MTSFIRHVIPQIGVQDLPLYPPADSVFERLKKSGENWRLSSIKHLGALSIAFPGTRQARWDYTLAMLYYSANMRVANMNSPFSIGRVHFSSQIAALQTLSLLWNIGHLPGTFSVEKGVYRYLYDRNPSAPAATLIWPHSGEPAVQDYIRAANALLRSRDYLAVARVLAVIKALSIAPTPNDDLYILLQDFAAPFLLETTLPPSSQWTKLRPAFQLVRHLAYLTIDSPFTGRRWFPPIPDFFRDSIALNATSLGGLHADICEVLSPIERGIYQTIYHSPAARRECAFVTELVNSRLSQLQDAPGEINKWTTKARISQLRLRQKISPWRLDNLGTVTLRSYMISLPDRPAPLETEFRRLGFSHPLVLLYPAWNADVVLEPDEEILDLYTEGPFDSRQVGKLILWLMAEVDSQTSDPKEIIDLLQKNDLEPAYTSLVQLAFNRRHSPNRLHLVPWPLTDFGLFPDARIPDARGAIWAANARIDDPFSKHILRDRSSRVPSILRNQYNELLGIKALRQRLRSKWVQKELRFRWLLVTASIRITPRQHRLIELDGGLVRISTRSGRMTLFLLETKTAGSNPLRSIARRLESLGIKAIAYPIGRRHAVAEIAL
jgi:hypothetical protein